MSALTFMLKTAPNYALNCAKLTPNLLAGLTLAQIKNMPLGQNKNAPKVSDFFEVSGDDTENIIFKNSTAQLDYIGHKMTRGNITIVGDCGDFLGSQMQNGNLICHGSTGDRAGDLMRRGLILIDDDAGDYCASRMMAGTIGVFGTVGRYAGFTMKRGTLLLTQLPTLHASIQNCGIHTLPFLSLLFKSFTPFETQFSNITTRRAQRFVGDAACNGNGEILVLLNEYLTVHY